jgi:hypothetical protein
MLLALLLTASSLVQGEISPTYGQTAFDKATHENRRVLVLVDAQDEERQADQERLLNAKTLRRVLQYEYVQIRMPEPDHPDASHQVAFRIHAADRTPLAAITFSDLRDGEGQLDPDRLLDHLKKHQAEPWDALGLLEQTRVQAVAENKRLLVHLGAPW